jgi:hypothetical protein
MTGDFRSPAVGAVLAAALLAANLARADDNPGAFWHVAQAAGGAPAAWTPPKADTLLAWYPCNLAQTTLTDLSGRGYTGTNVKGCVWQEGGYYRLAGTTNYIDCGFPAITTNMRVQAVSSAIWARWEAWKANAGFMCSRGSYLRGLVCSTEGTIREYSIAGTLTLLGMPSNEWVHLASTYSGVDGKQRVYTNGVLASTSSALADYSNTFWRCDDVFRVGYDDFHGIPFVGLLDSVMFWTNTLTASDVTNVMFNTGPNAPDGLEGDGT